VPHQTESFQSVSSTDTTQRSKVYNNLMIIIKQAGLFKEKHQKSKIYTLGLVHR